MTDDSTYTRRQTDLQFCGVAQRFITARYTGCVRAVAKELRRGSMTAEEAAKHLEDLTDLHEREMDAADEADDASFGN